MYIKNLSGLSSTQDIISFLKSHSILSIMFLIKTNKIKYKQKGEVFSSYIYVYKLILK